MKVYRFRMVSCSTIAHILCSWDCRTCTLESGADIHEKLVLCVGEHYPAEKCHLLVSLLSPLGVTDCHMRWLPRSTHQQLGQHVRMAELKCSPPQGLRTPTQQSSSVPKHNLYSSQKTIRFLFVAVQVSFHDTNETVSG